MKRRLDCDEMYPCFTLNPESSYGKLVEVSEDFAREHDRVYKEFDELQKKLEKLYREQTE